MSMPRPDENNLVSITPQRPHHHRRYHDSAGKLRRHHLTNPTRPLQYNGIAEIGIGGSLGTLFSEWAVVTTGCGPADMSDSLERGCYLICLMFAGLSVFWR